MLDNGKKDALWYFLEKAFRIKEIREYSKQLIRLLLCFLLLHLHLIDTVPLLIAADEQSSKTKLDQAEESYYNGDPRQSIRLVQQCLEDSLLSKDNHIRAYKILARSYLTLEEYAAAKQNLLLLLELDPTYQPTLEEESPRFLSLVDEARIEYTRLKAEQARQKTGIKPWMWMGAGGVAVTAIIVLVATASSSEANNNPNQPLSAPPPLP